jgi:hypothetical protein
VQYRESGMLILREVMPIRGEKGCRYEERRDADMRREGMPI